MTVEYRAMRPEEQRQSVWASRVGFGESTADAEIDRVLEQSTLRPEWILCAFEDGLAVSKIGTYPRQIRWNGRDIDCGAVTAVSTLPTHRRRGYLRELMTRTFVTMRESGQPVAMLWASMAAIYQRFGYGIAYTRHIYSFDPRHVRFVDEVDVPGRLRMVPGAEAPAVVADAYRRFAAPRTLMFQRSEDWHWKWLITPWRAEEPPPLVAVYEEAGEVRGYLVYHVERHGEPRPGPDQRLIVSDFAWTTPAAHRALVRYLIGHDLVDQIALWRMPADDLFRTDHAPFCMYMF